MAVYCTALLARLHHVNLAHESFYRNSAPRAVVAYATRGVTPPAAATTGPKKAVAPGQGPGITSAGTADVLGAVAIWNHSRSLRSATVGSLALCLELHDETAQCVMPCQ